MMPPRRGYLENLDRLSNSSDELRKARARLYRPRLQDYKVFDLLDTTCYQDGTSCEKRLRSAIEKSVSWAEKRKLQLLHAQNRQEACCRFS